MGNIVRGRKPAPRRLDIARARVEIPAALDIMAEYEALGVRFADGPASPDGWHACHAVGRDDRNPSAAVKIAPGDPHHGRYKDHGGGGDSLAFFDFALEWSKPKFVDFITCLKHYADKAGIGIERYETHGRGGENIVECVYEYEDAAGAVAYASVRLIRPDGSKTFAQKRRTDGGWAWGGMKDVTPLPYGLPELLAARAADPDVTIFVVEGEKDRERLRAAGLVATTSHGGAKNVDRTWPHFLPYFKGARVAVLPDNDPEGRTYSDKVCSYLDAVVADVRLCVLPGLPPHGDVSDWMDAGGTVEGLKRLVAASPRWDGIFRHQAPGDGATGRAGALPAIRPAAGGRRVEVEGDDDDDGAPEQTPEQLGEVITFNEITAQTVRWLIPNMIPAAKMTLVAGAPDLGKSWLSLDLAARITVGGPIPGGGDDGPRFERAGVLILAAEDNDADTIKPRFMAAGGDPSLLFTFKYVMNGDIKAAFTLDFMDRLIFHLDRFPIIKGLLFDPVTSFLGARCDHNRAADVRAALEPLRMAMEERDITTLFVAHPNKTGSANAIDRISGSGALAQLARAVFMAFPDKENRGRRVLLPVKNNLAKERVGLAYRIGDGPRGEPVILWESEPIRQTAQEWIDDHDESVGAGWFGGNGGRRGGGRKTDAEAVAWLGDFLRKHGRTLSDDLLTTAKEAGFTRDQMFSAKKELGIKPKQDFEKRGNPWVWMIEGYERPTNGEPFA